MRVSGRRRIRGPGGRVVLAPGFSGRDPVETQGLEGGNVPLEESLALFEGGVGLAGLCSKRLDDTKRKIEILVKKPGGMAVEPMPHDGEDAPF